MPQVQSDTHNPSPRPELDEDDFNSPFLHDTTSATQVWLVVLSVVVTFVVIGFALYMA